MMSDTTMRNRGNQGFTLTELMVAITIFAVVMGAIYSAYMSQQRAYAVTEAVTEAQQNLRSAMYTLERDIRMIGYDPTSAGTFGFRNAAAAWQTGWLGTNTITFTWDSNGKNGYESGTSEYSSYRLSGTALQKQEGTAGGWNAVAMNISGMSFQYLNASGAVTATPADVRTVVVTLTASKDNHTKQLSARVKCRNLGL
ncbi:MAG: prepilin-type N-terminal cleavage/methylation domain-containing protein [Deltaproteobacteria bacterium]|nr:prepilin-type N-terminal cleavage/methylation domain-containing protein [Deltaproteobacteria bacterium]